VTTVSSGLRFLPISKQKNSNHETSMMRTLYMLRNTFFAVLAVLAVAASSQAANITFEYRSEPTPGSTTHQTWIVKAISDQPMQGFDFAGDGSNDPATGRGFFGPMQQVNPAGQATVYADANAFFPIVGRDVKEDSQFTTRAADVVVPAGFAEESNTLLQGIWAHSAPVGNSWDIAQLVIPTAAAATVSFRGSISTLEGVNIVENNVTGVVGGGGPEPLVAADLPLGDRAEAIINALFTATGGTAPLTWGNLQSTGGSPSVAATLSPTGQFQWHTIGSARPGTYSWSATVTDSSNPAQTDTASLTLNLIVPEPATMTMLGLALVGLACFRKRS
jgi:hypothetical protein